MIKNKKLLVIPIFIPHLGCPHQCIFCNQNKITGTKIKVPDKHDINKIVSQFLNYKGQRDRVEIAFYGGTFLGLDPDYIKLLLFEADKFIQSNQVHGIRFSTRPDSVKKSTLDLLKGFNIVSIELGAQSMDDHVLSASMRGHTALDTQKAAGLVKDYGYKLGIQMMVGLPDDDDEKDIKSAQKIISLKPDFVRIYPTCVFNGTRLASLYKKGKYFPLDLERCVTLVKKIYLLFKKHQIPVIRMGLQDSLDFQDKNTFLAGPYHPAFGHIVFSEIFYDMIVSSIKNKENRDQLDIWVNSCNISKARGLNNSNIVKLKKQFGYKKINVKPDSSLGIDEVRTLSLIDKDIRKTEEIYSADFPNNKNEKKELTRLEELFEYVSDKEKRDEIIYKAVCEGHSQQNIAKYLCISHTLVPKIVKIQTEKIRLFEKLKSKGIFWSYSKKISYQEMHDDIFIEYILKYSDFFDIKSAFRLFGKRKIKKVWEDSLKSDQRFIKLNLLIARVFLEMDVEADFFKGVENARLKKLKLLAS